MAMPRETRPGLISNRTCDVWVFDQPLREFWHLSKILVSEFLSQLSLTLTKINLLKLTQLFGGVCKANVFSGQTFCPTHIPTSLFDVKKNYVAMLSSSYMVFATKYLAFLTLKQHTKQYKEVAGFYSLNLLYLSRITQLGDAFS